jgi:hypothetical protein
VDGAGSYSVAHRAGLLPTELTGMWGWILLRSPHQGKETLPAPAPQAQACPQLPALPWARAQWRPAEISRRPPLHPNLLPASGHIRHDSAVEGQAAAPFRMRSLSNTPMHSNWLRRVSPPLGGIAGTLASNSPSRTPECAASCLCLALRGAAAATLGCVLVSGTRKDLLLVGVCWANVCVACSRVWSQFVRRF